MDQIELIKAWLQKMHINNATVVKNKEGFYVINVNGSVDLYKKLEGEKSLPEYIKFEKINGTFDISYNNLESLRGCPHIVRGVFVCDGNKISARSVDDRLNLPSTFTQINLPQLNVFNFDAEGEFANIDIDVQRMAVKIWSTGVTMFLKTDNNILNKVPIILVSPKTLDFYLTNNNPSNLRIKGVNVPFEPDKQFGAYYCHPIATQTENKIGLRTPYILLCLERLKADSHNDIQYQWLISKVLCHEFAHAQMDIYEQPYRPIDEFYNWIEEPLANMICLQCFRFYDRDEAFEFVKNHILIEPDNYRLGYDFYKNNIFDWMTWAKNKHELRNKNELKKTYLFYIHKSFSRPKPQIEKRTLARYYYQILDTLQSKAR